MVIGGVGCESWVVMRGARRVAALPCGRWSKWVVLGFWVVVVAVAGPLAGKLNGAQ